MKLYRHFLLVWLLGGGVFAAEFQGLVEPNRDIELSLPVQGRIFLLPVNEGDRVAEGSLLLALESRIEALEVDRRELIVNDNSEREAALAREVVLKEVLESSRRLHDRTGSVSREDLLRAELEYTLSGLEVKRLIQANERAKVELEMAREYLTQRNLAASFDAVVAELFFEEGESVQANQPVIRLVDDNECYLTVHVEAVMAERMMLDQAAMLLFEGPGEISKAGRVAFIAPIVDPSSGLRKVRLHFTNDAPRVVPGITARWVMEVSQ